MSESTQNKRISKVATELNVGVQTVIDFLTEKGFEDISRNSKISDEMYDSLLNEFGDEKTVKEESKKIIQNRLKRESISLDETQSLVRNEEPENEPEEILIKGLGSIGSPAPVIEENKPFEVEAEIKI